MQVKDIMTAHAEWVDAGTSLEKVAKILRDNAIGCLPVGENDRLVGMITDRDIAFRAVADGRNPVTTMAKDVMTKGITYCFVDQSEEEALELMERKQIHHLPVLSRDKRIVGMLSLSDLALRSNRGMRGDIIALASRDASRHGQQTH